MLSPLQFLIKFFSMSTLYGEGHTGGDVETNSEQQHFTPHQVCISLLVPGPLIKNCS